MAIQCVRERWMMFIGDANALGLYDALVQVNTTTSTTTVISFDE